MPPVSFKTFVQGSTAASTPLGGTEQIVIIQGNAVVQCVPDDLGGGGGATTVVSKTVAEMQALALASGFTAGQLYKITDAGDLGLFFRAATTSKLENDGIRVMLCPAYYGTGENAGDGNNWLGVWNANLTPASGDLVIWGGKVWSNDGDGVGTADTDAQLSVDYWTAIEKASFAASEYTPMIFGCSYDLTNNWICRQWDAAGNVFGIDFYTEENWLRFGFNPCDVSDWNLATKGQNFFNNVCVGVWNNSNAGSIIGNSLRDGAIRANSNAGDIYVNNVDYAIEDNSNNGSIRDNANSGGISGNTNTGLIGNNSNYGNIYSNFNGGAISNNSNRGNISDNSGNVTQISGNTNAGGISNNSNSGLITDNVNAGNIVGNSNTGSITNNANTGYISSNTNASSIDICYGYGNIESQTGGEIFGEIPKAVSAQNNDTTLGANANGTTFTDTGSAGTVRLDFEDVHPIGIEFTFFVTDNGIELNPGAVSQTIQFWDGSVSRNTPLVLLGAPGKSITIKKISATVWAGIAVNGATDND